MGSRGRPFFDLNEPPAEEDEESDGVLCLQPQKALPSSNSHASDLFASTEGSLKILNNCAFSHASSVSGFQPFVRRKDVHSSEEYVIHKKEDDLNSKDALSSNIAYGEETKTTPPLGPDHADAQAVEREEGEWSDVEGSADVFGSITNNIKHEQSSNSNGETAQKQGMTDGIDLFTSGKAGDNISRDLGLHEGTKDEVTDINKDMNCTHTSLGSDPEPSERTCNNSRHPEGNAKADVAINGHEESSLVVNRREVKGVEAIHALKCANNPGKRHKLDQHKEAMLGRKRSRQTMFLNLEDVKQAGSIKTSTPRRQTFSSPITTRTVKEVHNISAPAERSGERITKDLKQAEVPCNEGGHSHGVQ